VDDLDDNDLPSCVDECGSRGHRTGWIRPALESFSASGMISVRIVCYHMGPAKGRQAALLANNSKQSLFLCYAFGLGLGLDLVWRFHPLLLDIAPTSV
jgi:hypothetical protein